MISADQFLDTALGQETQLIEDYLGNLDSLYVQDSSLTDEDEFVEQPEILQFEIDPTGQPRIKKSDRRHKGRIRCALLACSLGDVLDVSATGMRIRHSGRSMRRKTRPVMVKFPMVDPGMRMECRVVWVQRAGIFRQEIGLEFIDLPADLRSNLLNVVRVCSDDHSYGRPCSLPAQFRHTA